MNNHKSFTLIELLVVIAIIGVLSAIDIVGMSNASAKARDSQRISELNQIKNVFEQYFYDDNFHYPTDDTGGSGFCMKDNSSFLASLAEYAPLIPSDPKGGDWPCYRYYSDSDGTGYILTCELESNSSYMQGDGGKSNDLYEIYDNVGYIEDYAEGGEGGGYFPASWLIGWDKRIEFTVDKDEVDATLSNFPVALILSSSAGIGNDDVTQIFDEISSNSLKLAVTTDNGTTECYVEVAHWDDGSEEAELYVKVPSISSSSDTTLYLYYDNDHADNTDYVGDTNDVIAESVWDANYKAVYHMSDGADTSHIYDSTSNDNDGTKKGANEPNEVAGDVGYAQDFDGSDYINLSNDSSLDVGTELTVMTLFKLPNVHVNDNNLVQKTYLSGTSYPYVISVSWSDLTTYVGSHSLLTTGDALSSDTWTLATLIWTGTKQRIYLGASQVAENDYIGPVKNNTKDMNLGRKEYGDSGYLTGKQDEVRISNIARTPGEIAATNSGLRDTLITYGSEETF